jgi:hypothetical protein
MTESISPLPRPVALKLQCASELSGELVSAQFPDLRPRDIDLNVFGGAQTILMLGPSFGKHALG